ncbi:MULTISPECIES: 3'-5' exonuclease [unclassified Streptomyces]|uniref:3'-5' exonuclease n=1 Tax=unclassified Streptomyces TaxID=2593676 RepID=UPI0033A57235
MHSYTHPTPPPEDHPQHLPHLFTRNIDTVPVHCVRPADTDLPTWAVYQHQHYLGTLHHHPSIGWYVQHAREHHHHLNDAIRALRRPPTWPHTRARAADWAHRLLNADNMCVINIQTTGLRHPRALQIAVTNLDGVLFNELLNPNHPIDPEATRLHHHTHHTTRNAPTFSDVLPYLTDTLRSRHCIAYNLSFVQHVLRGELARHRTPPRPARPSLQATSWHDAMTPIAHWAGLWSAKHQTYRRQKLHGSHEASVKCRALLQRLTDLGRG